MWQSCPLNPSRLIFTALCHRLLHRVEHHTAQTRINQGCVISTKMHARDYCYCLPRHKTCNSRRDPIYVCLRDADEPDLQLVTMVQVSFGIQHHAIQQSCDRLVMLGTCMGRWMKLNRSVDLHVVGAVAKQLRTS